MSHLKSVHGRQCQRNGSTCFRSRGERSEVQGLRIYGCHWERARREGEFENAVKGEHCSCMIPAGEEGGELMATGALVDEHSQRSQTHLLVGFFVFPMNLLIFVFCHFPCGTGGSRTLLVAMLLACSGRSGAWLATGTESAARTEVPLLLSLGSAHSFVFFQITVSPHMIAFSFISLRSGCMKVVFQ